VNRCLKSPREQRVWIGWKRHIGTTDCISAQDPEVEQGDLDVSGSQDWKRSWWKLEEWRTKQQREGMATRWYRGGVATRRPGSDDGTAEVEGKASKGGCARGDDHGFISSSFCESGTSSSDDELESWRTALESENDGFGWISGSRELWAGFGRSFEEEEAMRNRADPMTGSRVQ